MSRAKSKSSRATTTSTPAQPRSRLPLGTLLAGLSLCAIVVLGACDGISGLSDLEFGQGVGSPCRTDTDCDRDTYCAPALYRCEYQKELGDECLAGNECKNDFCADGVCCDVACDDICASCVLEGNEGICSPLAAGTDPDDECPGTPTCTGERACVGQFAWAIRVGDETDQIPVSVAYDSQGNVIVGGDFVGVIEIGNETLTSQGDWDVFLAQLSPTGELLWAQRFGGGSEQRLAGLGVDADDRIVMAGYFHGDLEIGAESFASLDYNNEVFVAQLSNDGTPLWARHVHGTVAGTGMNCDDVAVDADGNVAITGEYHGDIILGSDTYASVADYNDMYLAMFDASGELLWGKAYTSTGGVLYPEAVAFDASGNLLFGGSFGASVDFGTGLIDPDYDDVFVTKLNSAGVTDWVRTFGSSGYQYLRDIATDSDGNIVLAGAFTGAVGFGGSELTAEHDLDIFFAKLTPSGSHLWSHRYGGQLDQEANVVAVGQNDDIALTGMFTLAVRFGEEDADEHLCNGWYDVFVAKFDADGELRWSQPYGGLEADVGNSVAMDQDGNVALVGQFEHRIDIAGTVLDSEGGEDGFIAVFAP